MFTNNRSGQSLAELLIAISIGAVVVTVALSAIQLTIKSNNASVAGAQATPLGQGLSDKLKSISESSWFNLFNLARGTTDYFLVNDGGFKVVQGIEGLLGDNIANGLVGHWQLDEPTGSAYAYDASTKSNRGNLSGGPTQAGVSNCKIGGCLSFNGSSRYVAVPDSTALSPTSAVSVATWVKTTASPTGLGVITKGPAAGDYDYMLYLTSNGNAASFYIKDSSGASDSISSTFNTKDNLWHHYIAVFDGDWMFLYIDGILQTSKNTARTNIRDSSNELNIGRGWGQYFNGSLDDVRVYNRALSVAEVAQLYRSSIYTRSFVVDNVFRTGNDITTSGTLDPSTLKVTAKVSWPQGSGIQVTKYLSRSNNAAKVITDWKDPASYSAISPANSIDTNTPGEIKLFQ